MYPFWRCSDGEGNFGWVVDCDSFGLGFVQVNWDDGTTLWVLEMNIQEVEVEGAKE
jgi:hypothetical protein